MVSLVLVKTFLVSYDLKKKKKIPMAESACFILHDCVSTTLK